MKWILALLLFFSIPVFSQLKPGFYRWEIERSDAEKIVFTTLVKPNGKQLYLINGNDSMLVDDIRRIGDSIYIELPFFESSFMVKVTDHSDLNGRWIKKSAGVTVRSMTAHATYGVQNRFPAGAAPQYDISGEWATTFGTEPETSVAGGEFNQEGNRLTGTFRTPYGDYRFLEGVVSGDSVYLSGFDGGMAMLFRGQITGEEIRGKMFSGNSDARQWVSRRGESKLPTNLTKVKAGSAKINFRFPDVNGKMVSNTDPTYKNKVLVIQIMGSWCPNCLDEMKFVLENYDRYKKMGVEFIALAYERTDNFKESKKALQPFLSRFQIPYPIVIPPVAVSDEQRAEKTLPQLESIQAFPTTIFVDKSGNIAKVHTGFDGPATGIHFIKYKEEFEKTLRHLTAQ